jgi:hypothetical protein
MMAWKRIRRAAIVLILPAVFAAGCGDDDNPAGTDDDNLVAPALPDQQSMAIDNTPFEAAAAGSKGTRYPNDREWVDHNGSRYDNKAASGGAVAALVDSASYSNYVTGRAVATVVGAAITVHSAAPAWAFQGAFGATPVKQQDGSWSWSYSLGYGQAMYSMVLNGMPSSEGVNWTMRVSTVGLTQNVTNFLWYSGQTTNGGAAGYWQLYDVATPSVPVSTVRVDWARSSADNRSATWLNNRVGGQGYGDTLVYSQNEDDVSMTFTNASSGEQSFVRWNVDTTAGSVRVPLYNGGQEACWDSQHLNKNCDS